MSALSNRVFLILQALNTIQKNAPFLKPEEERELAEHLNAIASAFDAGAPDDVEVPHISEISLALSDVAGMVRDAYGIDATRRKRK